MSVEEEALVDEVLTSVAVDRALRESKRRGEEVPVVRRRTHWSKRLRNVAHRPVVYEKTESPK